QDVDNPVAKIWSVWHPIFVNASLVMLDITVRLLYADLIAKTMGGALSPTSVSVYLDTVALPVRKHIVNHRVKMEAHVWPEISAPAHMVLWDQDVIQWFATGTVKMVANVSLRTPASVNLAGMDLPAAQQCVIQCVSMVVPVLSQMFACVHMDSLVPTVRMDGEEKDVTLQSVNRNVRMVGSVLDRVPVIVLQSGKDSSVKHVILESSVGGKFRYKDIMVEEVWQFNCNAAW
ncbi:hypothetical protein DV515_00001559, partial [Chloebia gouldiae]